MKPKKVLRTIVDSVVYGLEFNNIEVINEYADNDKCTIFNKDVIVDISLGHSVLVSFNVKCKPDNAANFMVALSVLLKDNKDLGSIIIKPCHYLISKDKMLYGDEAYKAYEQVKVNRIAMKNTNDYLFNNMENLGMINC